MPAPSVRYLRTGDGFDIAYGVSGSGMPVVFGLNPLGHVQLLWEPIYPGSELLKALAERFRLIQFDPRGLGMSSRGLKPDHTIEDYAADLDALVEHLGLESFVLLGGGCMGHVAVYYAHTRPERLAALILFNCGLSYEAYRPKALYESIPVQDWNMFLRNMAPLGLSPKDLEAYVELLDQMVTSQDWLQEMHAFSLAGGMEGLLPNLQTPTLVVHARDYHLISPEESMKVARLANARFALIAGANAHGEPDAAIAAIEDFLAALEITPPEVSTSGDLLGRLSQREAEILKLVALGKSNKQIANELVISFNTVQRHVGNILTKTGLTNRTEAAAYAHRHHLV